MQQCEAGRPPGDHPPQENDHVHDLIANDPAHAGATLNQVTQLLPHRDIAAPHVPFENNMSRLTRKAAFRSAVVLIILAILMVLVTLTNPSAFSMTTATLLIGVAMIAIASFAGL